MIVMAAKPQLKSIRTSMIPKVSQEDIARAANITLATYRNAESGKNVSYTTATAILRALNSFRSNNPLELADLGLSIV